MLSLDKEEANIREEYTRFVVQSQEKFQELEERIVAKKQDTERLNKRIKDLNVDVWEEELKRNKNMESEYKDKHDTRFFHLIFSFVLKVMEIIDICSQSILFSIFRIDNIMKRGKLLRKIQKQFNEILVLQTELELLRLRTYPTLKYNPIQC